MSKFSIVLSEASEPLLNHLPDFLRLFDEATLWLGSQGRTGQWGHEAPSGNPHFVQRTKQSLEVS